MFQGQLTGIVGRDPEMKFLDNGSQVANFSIAVRQPRRQGTEPPARWVRVSIWGKAAQFVSDYIRKGDRVLVWGDVDAPEVYQNRSGESAISERLKASNIEKLFPAGSDQAPAATPAPARPAPAPVAAPAPTHDHDDPPF